MDADSGSKGVYKRGIHAFVLMQNACYVDEFCMLAILASFHKIVVLDIYISTSLYFLV